MNNPVQPGHQVCCILRAESRAQRQLYLFTEHAFITPPPFFSLYASNLFVHLYIFPSVPAVDCFFLFYTLLINLLPFTLVFLFSLFCLLFLSSISWVQFLPLFLFCSSLISFLLCLTLHLVFLLFLLTSLLFFILFCPCSLFFPVSAFSVSSFS